MTFSRKQDEEPTFPVRYATVEAIADLAMVRATSGKPISETMTVWLALVIFDGYEIGGRSHDVPTPSTKL